MKKLSKITLFIMTAIILTFTCQSTLNQKTITAQAAVAKLNKSTLTLITGQSSTLKVSGTAGNVTWSSSNKSIASVSNGKVKAMQSGTATITASVNGRSYRCKVSILPSFKVDAKAITNELNGRYVTWMEQEIQLEAKDISNVEIESATTSSDKSTKTVTVNMTVDRTVVKLNLNAILTYTGNTKKWAVSKVEMSASADEYNISGSYIGNAYLHLTKYLTNFTSRYMELKVENMKSDGIFTGTITLSANADSPTADTDVYNIKGGINAGTGVITIVILEHVSGCATWDTFDDGSSDSGFYVDAVNRGISGSGATSNNSSFAASILLTKDSPNTITIK